MIMSTKAGVVMFALLAGGLIFFPGRDASAFDCAVGKTGPTGSQSIPFAMKGWIELHRPDGEVVRVRSNQIVFVTPAAGTGAVTCAQSRLQLVSGFIDVRESIEEVMRSIQVDWAQGQDDT
jgi:hypothetical protein